MIKSYPKIFAIGTDYIRDLFKGPVEVTEKLDGSQFCFGKDIEGNFYMRSKGAQIFSELSDKTFLPAVTHVLSIQDMIPKDIVFYCETLARPKHNTLKYEKIPKNNLYLFGVSDYYGSNFGFIMSDWADKLNIDCANIFHVGYVEDINQLKSFLEKDSYLGGCKIEGFVVKNYDQPFLLGGQPIPVMAGKLVSELFKEVHREKWADGQPKGKWELFKESYRTEARWQKAIQHARDDGWLENVPQDIGKLLKSIQQDIIDEEKEIIKDFLWKEFGQEVLRKATAGFPEWYKEKLAERSFNK
jgi:hypothetical protein